jgi:hypothetical protein
VNFQFSPDELADYKRSFNRLVLAAQDMEECRAAAQFLHEATNLSGDVRRALETGIAVAYARPWGKTNTIGVLPDHWKPTDPDQLTLHDELITVRNKVYAHTDEESGARWVADVSKMLKTTGPYFAPAWRPLNLDYIPQIAELAESQKTKLAQAAFELLRRLQAQPQ